MQNDQLSFGIFRKVPSYSNFYLNSYQKHMTHKSKPSSGYTRYMIFFIGISTILLLIPYFVNTRANLNSVLASTLQDSSVKTMSSIAFGISIPLFCELMTSSIQTQFYWLRLVCLVLLDISYLIITFEIKIHHFPVLFIILSTMIYHFINGIVLTIIYKAYKQIFRPCLIWGLLITSTFS